MLRISSKRWPGQSLALLTEVHAKHLNAHALSGFFKNFHKCLAVFVLRAVTFMQHLHAPPKGGVEDPEIPCGGKAHVCECIEGKSSKPGRKFQFIFAAFKLRGLRLTQAHDLMNGIGQTHKFGSRASQRDETHFHGSCG